MIKMRSMKEDWPDLARGKFESRLELLGWDKIGKFFVKGGLAIETGNHGLFLYEGRNRSFGLSNECVDSSQKDFIGPLVRRPFSKSKIPCWLDLITGQFINKRP
jgi:hypothetical protein